MKKDFQNRKHSSFVFSTIICLLLLSTSCKKSDVAGPNSGPGGGSQKDVIQGNIYDAQGHKFHIAGATAEVHIYGTGDIGQTDPSFVAKADENGHYAIKVPNNVYAVNGWAYMTLNGQTVAIDLKPMDGKDNTVRFPSAPGVVRNFALQLTGEIPGGYPSTIQGYYGGKVWFADGSSNFNGGEGYFNNLASKYPGATVHFLLTPTSPLIDGTTGEEITEEVPVEDLKSGKWFVNIPYAAYSVTAKMTTAAGEEKLLRLSRLPNINSSSENIDLSFPTDQDDPFQRPKKEQVAVWDN